MKSCGVVTQQEGWFDAVSGRKKTKSISLYKNKINKIKTALCLCWLADKEKRSLSEPQRSKAITATNPIPNF